jgi:hypothetical protein
MRQRRKSQAVAGFLLWGLLRLTTQIAAAQAAHQVGEAGQLGSASSTQDLLTQMVKRSSVIFAGGVYAVQSPQDKPGVSDIYLRVDQSVRGVDTGKGFVLRLPQAEGQSFHQGDHFFLLLGAPDASGLSQPVGGLLGILPVDSKFNVDLARLHAAVQREGGAGSKADSAKAAPPGKTNDAAGTQGQDAAGNGARSEAGDGTPADAANQMGELEQPTVSFLAMLRDLFVLSAQQTPQSPQQPQRPPDDGGHADAQLGGS